MAKVSLKKRSASPKPKSGVVQLIPYDLIDSFPARAKNQTVVTGNITLAALAKAIAIEVTARTIDITQPPSGDPDAEGVTQQIVFEHPGIQSDSENFFEEHLGKPFIVISDDCSGDGARVVGWKCNPVFLSIESQDNGEGAKTIVTLAQQTRSRMRVGFYKGTPVPNESWNDPDGDAGSAGGGL